MFVPLTLVDPKDSQQKAIAERFRAIRPVVYRKTSEIEGATWREVSRFGGIEAERFGTDAEVAKSVRASITLADELFLTYADASPIVDPVLLHYGCMWLAGSLVYAKSTDPSTFDSVGHGLNITFGGPNRVLLDAKIQMRNVGRIQMLSAALAGSDLADKAVQLIDVIRAIPELDPFLEEMGEQGTSAFRVIPNAQSFSGAKFHAGQSGHHLVQVLGVEKTVFDLAFLQKQVATLAALVDRNATLTTGTNQISWSARDSEEVELRTLFMATASGDYYLERFLPNGLYVPELVAHLIFLHALSTLARYFPKTWVAMFNDYTPEYHLVREFIAVSQIKYPVLLLNELAGRSYVFE